MPGDNTTIQYMELDMAETPRGAELIFEVDDRRPETGQGCCGGSGNGRPQRSCRALPPATTGVVQVLEDMGGGESGVVVWSCTDYILGSDRCIFQNVSARDLRHNSDHIVVLGCL